MEKEKIREFLTLFRVPLIFGVGGIFLLTLALIFLVKSTISPASEVVFTTESSSSASLLRIRIDVAGAVENPGVYELPLDSRIDDALVIAGGLSLSANREWIEKNLNRAAKLTDGGKIYIPKTGEISASSNRFGTLANVSTGRVNINTASQSELENLSGVGPVTAGKIISGRPYQTIDELKTKKVVGTALFEKIKGEIGL